MRPSSLRRAAFALAIGLASCLAISRGASADTTRAREAYDRGVRAHASGDHAAAARAFAEADALAPTAASLEAALESAMRADDPVLGAELLDRAAGRPTDPSLARTLDAARRRLGGRAGKLVVECGGAIPCIVSVDGVASDATRPVYARAGAHDVVVQRGEERFQRLVQVEADAATPVTGPRPVQMQPWSEEPRGSGGALPSAGLPRQWFYAGLVATGVAGGLALASGVDTVSLHDRFEADGCSTSGSGPVSPACDEAARSGKSAQLRTNVLLAVTGVFAVATIVTLFTVRWSDGTSVRATASATPSSAAAGFEIQMP